MVTKLTTSDQNLLLLAQFIAVATLIWLMYRSIFEAVFAGCITVVLMYVLFLRTEEEVSDS